MPETITVDYDKLNDDNDVELVFTRQINSVGKQVYILPTHTAASPQKLELYRTFPKRSGNNPGARKVTMKITLTKSYTDLAGNSVTGPVIMEQSFSIPDGVADADVLEARMLGVAILDKDTLADPLVNQQVFPEGTLS
jgi:hypothetical protein